MGQSLKDLRKAAGFKTAKEFAVRMDIPPATYSRYETRPERIPLSAAWDLADWFKVSIDAIVGRSGLTYGATRTDIQQAYDSLAPRSKCAVEEFLAFLAQRDSEKRRCTDTRETIEYDALCLHYERLYLTQIDEKSDFGDPHAIGSPKERRDGYRSFLEAKAKEKRTGKNDEAQLAKRDEAIVEKLMEAWDRMHELPTS